MTESADQAPPSRRRRFPRSLLSHPFLVVMVATALAAVVVSTVLVARVPPRPGSPLVAALAKKVEPAIVDISSTLDWQHADQVGTGTALTGCQVLSGSGILLTKSGEVLTNNHVIAEASSITARDVGNGQTYTATVIGYDRDDDLAVLRLRSASRLRPISVAAAPARVGEGVFLIGNAGGIDGSPAVTGGRVRAFVPSVVVENAVDGTTETLTGMIESSASSAPGDSGGALVNQAGKVIGINVAGFPSACCGTSAGWGLAIPISRAISVALDITSGRPTASVHVGPTAYLGVEVVPPQSVLDGLPHGTFSFPPGALITRVQPHSPAAQAHLSDGDEIVSLAGRPVDSPDELIDMLQSEHPGAVVTVRWMSVLGVLHASSVRVGSGPPQ